jgi:hypothetical protein
MIINDYAINDKPLNKSWTHGIFVKIVSSQASYISKESIDLLNIYKGKDKDLDDAKKLWKSLLIDAISILKINDSREKIYQDLKKDRHITRENFDKIRKTSSFGIDELSKYLHDFVEYESVLYGTNKFYRDHINHVFQVWAIGVVILSNYDFQLNDKFVINKKYDFHFQIPQSNKSKKVAISKSEIWAMWIVISLCHDLGYPIEKSSKINKQTKKILSYFGNIQFTELDFNFNMLNSFLVQKLLNIISSRISSRKNETSDDSKFHTSIQPKYQDKLSKSLEENKHRIFSSLLLFKSLTFFLETDYCMGDKALESEDARQLYIRKEILRSIAGHTCPKLYHLRLDTLSFLLILCDELQEWNRPSFESYTNKNKENEPSVRIKNISFLKAEQKIHIEMIYETEKKGDYENYLIRNKFRNIHYLLRSAVGDKNRMMIFIWDIYVGDIKYQFTFDSKKHTFEQLNILKTKYGISEEFELYN